MYPNYIDIEDLPPKCAGVFEHAKVSETSQPATLFQETRSRRIPSAKKFQSK